MRNTNPNQSLQPTANSLRGLSTAELVRLAVTECTDVRNRTIEHLEEEMK